MDATKAPAFSDSYDELSDDARKLLLKHGWPSDYVAGITRYHAMRAVYFLFRGVVASYDNGSEIFASERTPS